MVTASASDNLSHLDLHMTNDANNADYRIFDTVGNQKWGIGSYGDANQDVENNFFVFQYTNKDDKTVNERRFVINDLGNVGIGDSAPGEKLSIAGSVKIVDGTQGKGKVLTSNANGVASWQDLNFSFAGSVPTAIAIGKGSKASNQDAIAIGTKANAEGPSSLAIGSNNFAEGYYSSAIGGASHSSKGHLNTIVGGYKNIASGFWMSTVVGGFENRAEGAYATVLGAFRNNAAASHATALGSSYNSALGNYSMAIGTFTKALVDNSFVIGKGVDSKNRLELASSGIGFAVNSTKPTMFVKAASGKDTLGSVGIGTNKPQAMLDVRGELRASEINGVVNLDSEFITAARVEATSFKGDGSELKNINPKNIEGGLNQSRLYASADTTNAVLFANASDTQSFVTMKVSDKGSSEFRFNKDSVHKWSLGNMGNDRGNFVYLYHYSDKNNQPVNKYALTVSDEGNVGLGGIKEAQATLDINGTLRLARLSSPPINPADGTIYRTMDGTLCIYDKPPVKHFVKGRWKPIGSGYCDDLFYKQAL